jgi:hypothetical protein
MDITVLEKRKTGEGRLERGERAMTNNLGL